MRHSFTPQLWPLLMALLFLPVLVIGQSAESVARQHVLDQHEKWGLTAQDVNNLLVKDQYLSSKSGITHVYLIQAHEGIEVFNSIINVNVGRDGAVISSGNRAIADLGASIKSSTLSLTAAQAAEAAAHSLGLIPTDPFSVLETSGGDDQEVLLSTGGISLEPIPAKLVYQPLQNGDVRLAWDVSLYLLDAQNWWSLRIDAATGDVLHKLDWVNKCSFDAPAESHASHTHAALPASPGRRSSKETATKHIASASQALSASTPQYRIYDSPIESPSHGDRSLVSADQVVDATASPFGWHDVDGVAGHDFNIARGNNVHAYYDGNNLNSAAPTLTPADGGLDDAMGTNHVFDFPADLEGDPLLYRDAAITNLFYWNNLIHDVFYRYGFDEPSGNFQQNNYNKGGVSNDWVFAEAQDGSGANNANFATPPDGRNPRMQMFLWTGNPRRDGDFDNGVIVHEYGHGISNRLTGGPATTSCLSNEEQMGEGWSDWFALMMTMRAGDTGPQRRGIGTYVLYEDPDGRGIRPSPYSTDFAVNNYTYKDIAGLRAPHGVGFVWATMLWEVTWGLVEKHGFDPDLHHGTGGNNIAMELVTLALKLQPCSPGFIDGRDAIIEADKILYGGANYEIIYTAFAKRGLGFSADQGSSSSKTDGVEAFDMPTIGLELSVDNASIGTGGTLTYTLTTINRSVGKLTDVRITNPLPEHTTFVSASDGGSFSSGVVSFPAVDLEMGEQAIRTFKVRVNTSPFTTTLFLDDIEDEVSNTTNWTRAGAGPNPWEIDDSNTFSGTKAWFVQDPDAISDQYLIKSFTLDHSSNNHLSFWHEYDTEPNYDGGVVELSTDGGLSWQDLGHLMVKNGYNSGIAGPILGIVPYGPLPNRRAFSGQSGDYINTIIDLSDYNGQTLSIRWRMGTDIEVNGVGWWVDDVAMLNAVGIKNEACVTTSEGYSACADLGRLGTIIFEENIPEPIVLTSFTATGREQQIALEWITAAESNNSGFELQRKRDKTWETLAWIASKGESRTHVKYKYTDKEVLQGVEYTYRLRQLDIHGNERFSEEVSASAGSTANARLSQEKGSLADRLQLSLYPNPANSRISVLVTQQQDQAPISPVSLVVYDLGGTKVYSSQISAKASQEPVEINVASFPAGLYILKVVTNEGTVSKKLEIYR